jgi:mRNA-degrading endonuclease toxin of MazEF toxin-antitoxin module
MEWVEGATRRTVLVVSNDEYNGSTSMPVVMRLVRTGPASPYLVPLADADPVGGRVLVGSIGPIHAVNLRQVQGVITGATLERVRAAARLLLDL